MGWDRAVAASLESLQALQTVAELLRVDRPGKWRWQRRRWRCRYRWWRICKRRPLDLRLQDRLRSQPQSSHNQDYFAAPHHRQNRLTLVVAGSFDEKISLGHGHTRTRFVEVGKSRPQKSEQLDEAINHLHDDVSGAGRGQPVHSGRLYSRKLLWLNNSPTANCSGQKQREPLGRFSMLTLQQAQGRAMLPATGNPGWSPTKAPRRGHLYSEGSS